MSYYYLKDKIEEIRAKDISDEEKREEIKKLVESIQTRRKESTKKQDRQAIAVLLVIIAIFIVSAIFAILDIGFGDTKYYIGISIFSLVGFIFFIYCIFQKIKLTKKENHWKNIMKDETSELQRLCEEICNNINADLKRKRNKIGISKLIFVLGVTLP